MIDVLTSPFFILVMVILACELAGLRKDEPQ